MLLNSKFRLPQKIWDYPCESQHIKNFHLSGCRLKFRYCAQCEKVEFKPLWKIAFINHNITEGIYYGQRNTGIWATFHTFPRPEMDNRLIRRDSQPSMENLYGRSSQYATPITDHVGHEQLQAFNINVDNESVNILPSLPLNPSSTRMQLQNQQAQPRRSEDPLSSISQASLKVEEEHSRFVMSTRLQSELREAREYGHHPDVLLDRLMKEAEAHAKSLKEFAREELKEAQKNRERTLTRIQISKLRSRREARVHRIKSKAFENALKDALGWFIYEI